MEHVWTWFLGLGILGYLINIWFRQRVNQNKTNELFNEVLDGKIAERDEAIKAAAEKQAKTLEDYYAKAAKYNADHKCNVANPNKGND